MKKSEKIFFVDNLTSSIRDAKSFALIDITGLKVSAQEKLRHALREVDAKVIVAKNTLLLRALKQTSAAKALISETAQALSGQTAIVLGNSDEISPIQTIGKFAREFDLPRFKAGVIGKKAYSGAALLAISRLPSREVLAGQAVGAIAAPLYNLVGILQGKMRELIYILSIKSQAPNPKQ